MTTTAEPTPAEETAPDPALLATTRHLLHELGLDPTVLATLSRPATAMPTFTDYLPRVRAAASPGTLRTYGTYWDRMERLWGERRLDDITATDIEALLRILIATAVRRRNHRAGRNTGESLISAARAIYNRAIADGLIESKNSPAHRVTKPRRLPSTRRALTQFELAQIYAATRTSGNDVILDTCYYGYTSRPPPAAAASSACA